MFKKIKLPTAFDSLLFSILSYFYFLFFESSHIVKNGRAVF